MGNVRLRDLIDTAELQRLMEFFHAATAIPVGLMSPDGELQLAAGPQRLCADFHRKHPVTRECCARNDALLFAEVPSSGYVTRRCDNGLRTAAVPVKVSGEHVATMLMGQFMFDDEPLDDERIARQAADCEFPLAVYRAAWEQVPRFSQRRLNAIMDYFAAFVRLLSELGEKALKHQRELAQRTKAERRLQEHAQLVDTLLEAIPNPIFCTDTQGRYLDCNHPFASEVLGLPMERIIGSKASELHGTEPEQPAAFFGKRDEELYAEGGTQTYEARVQCADGENRTFLCSKALYTDADGNVAGIVCVMQDATRYRDAESRFRHQARELRASNMLLEVQKNELEAHQEAMAQVNRDLEEARAAAVAANRAKGHFLANMSHEIRTPMTAILGFVGQLADDCPRECPCGQTLQEKYISTITRNGEHLLKVISDILDFSKIEAGELCVETCDCAAETIAREVIDLLQPRADQKGLQCTYRSDGTIPQRIACDPTRLRQILLNLVGNAVKFTERGSIEIAGETAEADGEKFVQFTVTDTGAGMSAEQLAQVFEPFRQGDASTSRRFGGTGLGLAISRELAALLGGALTAESEPGRGSAFTLRVPAREPATPNHAAAPVPCTATCSRDTPTHLPVRLLVAEDGPDNQRLLEMMLTKVGAEVTLVDNGRAAVLAALESVAAGTPFDVILMDVQMPIQDGLEATGELRKRGYRLPILALTAHARREDEARCLAAGCNAYVSKPIDKGLLLRTIRDLVRVSARRSG
jgi:PAS domain S-box-containing protein